ncbi:MAG TPA: anaerobic carbon-monoxide dehydrogenase catalytic subunit [Clostridiales bacterium]|nr:anaerobic carbon-monoxide dehydrogenase catalytic subunit [Clostridiales bacterium]
MPRFRDTELKLSPSVPRKERVKDPKNMMRSVDPAALDMLAKYKDSGIITGFQRYVAQQPQCAFGYEGVCCRICIQGPCRVKGLEGEKSKGICGAHDYTIVARNIARLAAGGASAHSDHGREIVYTLLAASRGETGDYKVKDEAKLRAVAANVGISAEGKDTNALAEEIALAALNDFGNISSEPCRWLTSYITDGRKTKFDECEIAPTSIDRSVVSMLHQTHMGVDADPVNIIFGALKTSLADYVGMHISTDVSDILLGTPEPCTTEANLGVIKADKVNIILHGHNPLLSQTVVDVASEMEDEAKAAGAAGIQLSGICCTGNEVLMRSGVPIATNFSSQELAIMTGAADLMVVDVQCIMPSIRAVAECFNTTIVTTMGISKIPGSEHIAFDEEHAIESAQKIVRMAIEAYKKRQGKEVYIPQVKSKVVAGFSLEAILDLFGALNPETPMQALIDEITAGNIKGVAHFCGCNNLESVHDENHLEIVAKLLKENVFVIATGCAAQAMAKAGFMDPAQVDKHCGENLAAFIHKLEAGSKDKLSDGLPPAFHMGSCVDNSRCHDFLTLMAKTMGVDTPKVPFVATAPEAMSEKAISIGSGLVAMGVPTHVGTMPPIEGSACVYDIACRIASDVYGGYFIFETDFNKATDKLLAALDYRTWKMGVHKATAEKYEAPLTRNY